MNDISFSGGYLIYKPSPTKWRNIKKALPSKKCVFEDYNDNGDKFFAVKSFYDREMAKIILSKKVKFKFFPDINLKTCLDSYYPEEAREVVASQTNVIETPKQLRKFIKVNTPKKVHSILKYRWKPEDHIEKTYKALELDSAEYPFYIEKGITYITDKNGKIVAKASPNNEKGINFVYEYPRRPDDSSRKFALIQGGETFDFGPLQWKQFETHFMQNVKIDQSRKRSQKLS